jgi:alkanesulfonate monooxygenase SsuD/methylene tetrahydromethanopterin reductase-like flavin-dependent oxidoreductase (luciferase family)
VTDHGRELRFGHFLVPNAPDPLLTAAEAVQVLRQIWSGQRNLCFEGRYYRLAGAQPGPLPAHRSPIQWWR